MSPFHYGGESKQGHYHWSQKPLRLKQECNEDKDEIFDLYDNHLSKYSFIKTINCVDSSVRRGTWHLLHRAWSLFRCSIM